jgi:hypothetical protein
MTLARRVHGIDKNLEGRLVVQAGGRAAQVFREMLLGS